MGTFALIVVNTGNGDVLRSEITDDEHILRLWLAGGRSPIGPVPFPEPQGYGRHPGRPPTGFKVRLTNQPDSKIEDVPSIKNLADYVSLPLSTTAARIQKLPKYQGDKITPTTTLGEYTVWRSGCEQAALRDIARESGSSD